MNDGNWLGDFFDGIAAGANNWDISGKAEDVQEAAAEAMLAERERYFMSLSNTGPNDPRTGLGPDEFAENAENLAPYPADPYSMDIISEIPSHFMWLTDRDPSALPGKQKILDDIAAELATTLPDGIGNLQSLLVNNGAFTGRVADRFATFLDNMVDVAENQSALALELSTAVENMNGLLTAGGNDANSVADETITALNGIRDGDSGTGSTMGFTLTSAAIGVATAATAATAGLASIAWALLAGVVLVAGKAADEGLPSGETVEDVLNDMFDALTKRENEFTKREAKLVEALDADNGTADDNQYQLCPDTKPDNLYDGRGDFGAADTVLAADLADTHHYATHAVPRLAGSFSSASTSLSGAIGTGTTAMGPASTPWETLCTKLQRYSALTGNRLNDGGETLAKAVADFARQDGVHAKWVNETIERADRVVVPDPYTPPDARP